MRIFGTIMVIGMGITLAIGGNLLFTLGMGLVLIATFTLGHWVGEQEALDTEHGQLQDEFRQRMQAHPMIVHDNGTVDDAKRRDRGEW